MGVLNTPIHPNTAGITALAVDTQTEISYTLSLFKKAIFSSFLAMGFYSFPSKKAHEHEDTNKV